MADWFNKLFGNDYGDQSLPADATLDQKNQANATQGVRNMLDNKYGMDQDRQAMASTQMKQSLQQAVNDGINNAGAMVGGIENVGAAAGESVLAKLGKLLNSEEGANNIGSKIMQNQPLNTAEQYALDKARQSNPSFGTVSAADNAIIKPQSRFGKVIVRP